MAQQPNICKIAQYSLYNCFACVEACTEALGCSMDWLMLDHLQRLMVIFYDYMPTV